MNLKKEIYSLPNCFKLPDSMGMYFGGNYILRGPFQAGPAQRLLMSRAGAGNERWSVTLCVNKHEAHLHEAGDLKHLEQVVKGGFVRGRPGSCRARRLVSPH